MTNLQHQRKTYRLIQVRQNEDAIIPERSHQYDPQPGCTQKKRQLQMCSSRCISLQVPARTRKQAQIYLLSYALYTLRQRSWRWWAMSRLTLMRRLPDTLASRELLYMPGRDWSCNLKIEGKARTIKRSMFEWQHILDDHCLIAMTLKICFFNGY